MTLFIYLFIIEFLTGAVDMTEPQVQEKIAELTETATKVSKEK